MCPKLTSEQGVMPSGSKWYIISSTIFLDLPLTKPLENPSKKTYEILSTKLLENNSP
jgi:hypothetical protein